MALNNVLIGHYFDTEEEALASMPYIKTWKRETWDKRHIRYHSPGALAYWDKIWKEKSKMVSAGIHYKDGIPYRVIGS